MQLQLDLAGALARVAHGRELPVAVEVGERPVDQLHVHLAPRHMVLRVVKVWWMPPKAMPISAFMPCVVLLEHRGVVAPGQELGILGHVGDQGVHLLGAVPDEDGLVDGFHENAGPREAL